MNCPKCGSDDVFVQREQSGNISARQNKVYVQKPKKRHGIIWWIFVGWWWKFYSFVLFGWTKLFRHGGGLNFGAEKTINKTVAVCQNCGHTWKI